MPFTKKFDLFKMAHLYQSPCSLIVIDRPFPSTASNDVKITYHFLLLSTIIIENTLQLYNNAF